MLYMSLASARKKSASVDGWNGYRVATLLSFIGMSSWVLVSIGSSGVSILSGLVSLPFLTTLDKTSSSLC